jgi:hypothetical protein
MNKEMQQQTKARSRRAAMPYVIFAWISMLSFKILMGWAGVMLIQYGYSTVGLTIVGASLCGILAMAFIWATAFQDAGCSSEDED